MKYSILVPVYNVEKFLEECLHSLENQTISRDTYEVVITDDGSTDGSSRICDQYAEKNSNFRVIHQENEGLLLARKTGVIHAKGEYLVFVDSDDYVDPDLLETVDLYINRFSPDLLMYGWYDTYQKKEELQQVTEKEYELVSKPDILRRFAGSFRYNGVACKVIRRELIMPHIDEMYSDRRINAGEDRLQTAYLLKYAQGITLIKAAPYHYRIQSGSIVRHTTIDNLAQKKQVNTIVRAILVECLKKMTDTSISITEKKGLLQEYDLLVLSDLLDCLYKMNTECTGTEKHVKDLQEIVSADLIDLSAKKRITNRLTGYNRYRYFLLRNGKYRQLVLIDGALKRIQGLKNSVLGRQHIA